MQTRNQYITKYFIGFSNTNINTDSTTCRLYCIVCTWCEAWGLNMSLSWMILMNILVRSQIPSCLMRITEGLCSTWYPLWWTKRSKQHLAIYDIGLQSNRREKTIKVYQFGAIMWHCSILHNLNVVWGEQLRVIFSFYIDLSIFCRHITITITLGL